MVFSKSIEDLIYAERFKWIEINNERTEYIISSYGRIISMKQDDPKTVLPWIHKDHKYISICHNGDVHRYQVHRLVAIYFIPNPDNKPIVHHIDKNPLNNDVENLMWVTESEHKIYHKDEMDNNRPEPKLGSECNLSVYTDEQIHHVCKLLEENKLTKSQISDLTGVKVDTIKLIIKGKQWCHISCNYDVKNYNVKTPRDKNRGEMNKSSTLTVDTVRNICEKLCEHKLSDKEIAELYGTTKSIVRHIRYRETWTFISIDYDF